LQRTRKPKPCSCRPLPAGGWQINICHCHNQSDPLLSVIVMAHPYITDPKYWRERGEEARSIAQLFDDPEAKRLMLAISASYDRLAHHMKQRSRKFKKGGILRPS
jgi:hypothetical protein